MKIYPKKHKKIVTSLMDGKFITIDDAEWDEIKKNHDFYVSFFYKSFGFRLTHTQEFYYLVSQETNEKTSRDISIFFAIFCYELDKEGRNFIDELSFSSFDIKEIIELINNSAWSDIVKSSKLSDEQNITRLIGSTMVRRNITIKYPDGSYSFTKAYKYFIDFARDLVKSEEEE